MGCFEGVKIFSLFILKGVAEIKKGLYIYIIKQQQNMKRELNERLENLKKQLNYVNQALSSILENWERKEFEAIKAEYIEEIASLEHRFATCF